MKSEERKLVNARQKEFYDTKQKNAVTRLWSYFRNGALNRIKKDIGVERDIYELHKNWFGDLSQKKVLDLGCYAGNSLSFYLAQNSKEYLAIDLSPKGINNLSRRLEKIPGARAEVMDFLSEEFREETFDLIYAYGVLHHFKDVDELIAKLQEKLSKEGIIVSHDPLETSLPIKFIRSIYRPFQSDKAWEWPFSKKTYYKFEKAFEIKERRAVLGKAKWSAVMNFLPIPEGKRVNKAKAWHREDWKNSLKSDKEMFDCMHLSLLMMKKSQ
ncbi:methyltransferase [Salegentibacter salinarum]|uniref:Methyltransferase n=1 Tax=Salegentibacter salinarum TaxID=447422 RepID=A0A2N0U2B7_9FLAO|nr:class I SAM-dependent methyltransferase [Salegentibacter salinarum]PKD21153.1 methyltransferase [Salegentibacter salinarum]SKB76510.1 Methyltransferase domain-containing protein [Salegentibacter salinarum]